MPHGLLNLNKPPGPTSRDMVNLVEWLARPAKAGHAGTLDPLAGGVLVLCLGAATRLIPYVQRMPKRYTGTFLLGRQSPTEDIQGEVVALPDPPIPTAEQIAAAAAALVGQIQQRPPAFSALKVGGRRAYDLARQGRPAELSPRQVTVYAIEVLRYEYPEMVLKIECGGGTYVRSLGRDLAESLGTVAVMSALVRTAVGPFSIEDALDPRQLTAENLAACLRPMSAAVEMLPQVVLSAEEIGRIRNGLTIRREGTGPSRSDAETGVAFRSAKERDFRGAKGDNPTDVDLPVFSSADEIAALDAEGRLVAILRPRGPDLWGPLRNLPAEEDDGRQPHRLEFG